MATVRPVVRDPDSKKHAILSAARRLLVKQGFQDITMDAVAEAAGVAKGTLFLHFKGKEDLFEAAMADLVEGLGLELDALAKTGVGGGELLIALAKVLLSHLDHNRDFFSSAANGLPSCGSRASGRLLERVHDNFDRIEALVRAADKTGGKSLPDPRFATMAFFGLCRTAMMRKVVEKHDRPLAKEAEAIVSFFLNGSGVTL
jgi:TetR/AcrR family transcriptional regulator